MNCPLSVVGKKFSPEPRQQQRTRHRQTARNTGDEDARRRDEPREQPAIAGAHPLEAALESPLQRARTGSATGAAPLRARPQQVHGQRGHQRPRQDVGREHREDHRLGQRDEQVARDAAQEEHRQEHDADAERGDERRHRDLRRALQDGLAQLAGPPPGSARCSRWSTVASSTRMPTASASPPRVMMLMVSPSRLSAMTEVRIDSGIETAMISVLRQLPRKSRIIRRGEARRDDRLVDHPADRRRARRPTGRRAAATFSSGGSVGGHPRQRGPDACRRRRAWRRRPP